MNNNDCIFLNRHWDCINPCQLECEDCSDLRVECTPGYRLICNEIKRYQNNIMIQDVFSNNDGIPPYTNLTARIISETETIYNLEFIDNDKLTYYNAQIRPNIALEYYDNEGVLRNKIVNVAINIEGKINEKFDKENVDFIAKILNANASNVVFNLNLNRLEINLDLEYEMLFFYKKIGNLPVITKMPKKCKTLNKLPHERIRYIPIKKFCNVDTMIYLSNTAIAFNPVGDDPFNVEDLELIEQKPTIMDITAIYDNVAINIALPVKFTLVSSNDIRTVQYSILYATLILIDFKYEKADIVILNAIATIMSDGYIYNDAIHVNLQLEGNIVLLKHHINVADIAKFVKCGKLKPCLCETNGLPSTRV